MQSYWVEHPTGKKVFVANFSNFGTDSSGLFNEASEVLQVLTKEPPSSVLVITNVTDTAGTLGNLDVFRNLLPVSNYFVKKRAMIGVEGSRKTLMDIYNKLTGKVNLVAFSNIEEALEWIVQD